MKILWLSPVPSHPQTAGNRAHIFNIGRKLLAAGHDISFVLYGQEATTPEALEQMRIFWPKFFYIQHLQRARKKTLNEVWGIDDWFNSDIEKYISLLITQSFDCMICEYVFMSKALTLAPSDVFKVLNCADRMSNRDDMLRSCGIEPDFFYTTQEQEKIALDRADLIIAIQEDEKKFFQSLTSKKVIELGFQLEPKKSFDRRIDDRLRVGLLASGNSLNRKSMETFLEEIELCPIVSKKIDIVAAGTICAHLLGTPVTCMGVIEDEATFYDEVDIVINPMLDGTGLKIKTVSALQYGKPFLSTVAGSAGLPVVLDCHMCAHPADIVTTLKKLMMAECIQTELANLRCESEKITKLYIARQQKQFDEFLDALERGVLRTQKKPLLLVTDIPFWEEALGSHARIATLCRALMERFVLHIFFFGSIYAQRENQIRSAGFEGMVYSYKAYEEAAAKISTQSTFPHVDSLKRWRHEIFYKSLSLFLKKMPIYSTIIFEYLWIAYTSDALPYPALKILDTHDLMAYRHYRFKDTASTLPITLKQEMDIFCKFNAVLMIQKEELRAAQNLPHSALPVYCPHAVSRPFIAPSTGILKVNFGFIGGNSAANIHAIVWFIENVWVLQQNKDAALHIFGGVCSSICTKLQNIELHGKVEKLNDIYAMCNIMINPVVFGGGLKIKSIEALSFGKPLLASPEAVVGIDNPESSGIIVARSRKEFINAMFQLSNDKYLLKKMSFDALQSIARNFSMELSYGPLIKMIELYS